MKTAACIALLALAASACSKNDNTRTPEMTATPGSETDTARTAQMPPVEVAAPNEITTTPADGGATTGMNGAQGSASPTPAPGANGATANGNGVTDGNGTVFNPNAGPTAQNSGAPASAAPSRPDADNTRVNERDRGPSTTPMDQGNNETDLKITQKIRQAVINDGALSFTAKNVKIITSKGTVVLRGPVKSDDERARIDAAAKTVAGSSNVINEIEIKK